MSHTKTLADILQPYNMSEIARLMTEKGFPTSRDRMARMAKGLSVPTVRELPALAEIIRFDVHELTLIVAQSAVAS